MIRQNANLARRGVVRARKSARTRLWGNRSKREAGVVTPRRGRLLRSRVLRPVSLLGDASPLIVDGFSPLGSLAGSCGLLGASVQCGVTRVRVDGRVAYSLRL